MEIAIWDHAQMSNVTQRHDIGIKHPHAYKLDMAYPLTQQSSIN